MIEHQVYSNAFAYLLECGQSDCGFSHLETSKYIYGSGDGGFYPSTQRHYRRLIYYYIILLHVSVVRPSSGKNILIARVTQLTSQVKSSQAENILIAGVTQLT
jgi:hypothetical protein